MQPMLRTIMLHSVLEMRRRLKVKSDSLEVSSPVTGLVFCASNKRFMV